MPRPPKYTDDDIAGAIHSLIDQGKEVNPSRVKHLLGGGNIERIKRIIGRTGADTPGAMVDTPGLPPSMTAELRRHNDQNINETRRLATRLWQLACDEASKGRKNEDATLRNRTLDLEEKLSEAHRQSDTFTNENRKIVEQCQLLTEALRNAESDLRASGKTITILERTQRLDREEIRLLQNRVETLVAELATIKARD